MTTGNKFNSMQELEMSETVSLKTTDFWLFGFPNAWILWLYFCLHKIWIQQRLVIK